MLQKMIFSAILCIVACKWIGWEEDVGYWVIASFTPGYFVSYSEYYRKLIHIGELVSLYSNTVLLPTLEAYF